MLGQLTRPTIANGPDGLPKAVSDHMQPLAASYPEMAYWGEVLRLLTTLVKWRTATEETNEILLLSNCSGGLSAC